MTLERPQQIAARNSDSLAGTFATSYAGVLAFIAVVREGSFAKAGDRLGIGRSAVSRSVRKLEVQLEARLLHRTTRSTSLTREGELFFGHCEVGVQHIVQALEDMRDLRQGPPRGSLRVSATPSFGRKVVAPLLPGFHALHPDIDLELVLNDAPVDFIADRIDVAFRNGRMEDSQVVAKQIVPMRMLVCASADYAMRHGMPQSVEDIARHQCIQLRLSSGRIADWEFEVNGRAQKMLPPSARATFNDEDLVVQAMLEGRGIAQVAAYQVCDALRSGSVVTCLDGAAPRDRGHYICYVTRRQLPTRIRVFIDYMTEQIRALQAQSLDTSRQPSDSLSPPRPPALVDSMNAAQSFPAST